MAKLDRHFFIRQNVVLISKHLLGKCLFTHFNNIITGGLIVETEAYAGPDDKASHAYNNRRTKRTDMMFHLGGVAYVYLCYGMHAMFNIVTNIEGIPHAILVRAIQPTHGIDMMLRRRNKTILDCKTAGGPGALTKALGITTSHNGTDLTGNRIWIEDQGTTVRNSQIETGPRIGVAYAGKDAERPWRFRIKHNQWTSRA